MRDSLIFYRSFYEAIKELPKENQAEVYNAIFSYGLDFTEPNLSGISKTIWTLIKPQIDANIKRFKNGSKAKVKQNRSKSEAKQKQEESKVEANNNNNVNNNKKDNNMFLSFWSMYPKKVEKEKCKKQFDKLKLEEAETILATLPNFLAYKPFESYTHPNPSTYLNQKRWQDEIPENKIEPPKRQGIYGQVPITPVFDIDELERRGLI